MQVSDALAARKSVRAFKSTALETERVKALIEKASRAPSGGNVQPWQVIALAGKEKDAVAEKALAALVRNPAGEEGDYPIYPKGLKEPYRSRRYDIGERLYSLLGIAREDKARRQQQLAQNFAFFGAPVALFILIDRQMGHGQWAHVGMFMQSLALLAVEDGLGTCMQEAWGMVRETVRVHLGLPDTQVVYCAVALGEPDDAARINTLESPRAPVDEILTMRGF